MGLAKVFELYVVVDGEEYETLSRGLGRSAGRGSLLAPGMLGACRLLGSIKFQAQTLLL